LTQHVNSDIKNGKLKPNAPPAQLYDLEADLHQTQNLYREHPEIAREMKTLLDQYTQATRTAPKRN